MDSFQTFVLGLTSIGVAAFVGWTIVAVFNLRQTIHELEMRMSQSYVRRDAFDELRHEVRRMSSLMIEIAGKLGVPVRLE
jgi:hypothetical protein